VLDLQAQFPVRDARDEAEMVQARHLQHQAEHQAAQLHVELLGVRRDLAQARATPNAPAPPVAPLTHDRALDGSPASLLPAHYDLLTNTSVSESEIDCSDFVEGPERGWKNVAGQQMPLPTFGAADDKPWNRYLEDLKLWFYTTPLEPKRKGASMVAGLKGSAHDLAMSIGVQHILQDNAVYLMVRALAPIYGKEQKTLRFLRFKSFYRYTREKGQDFRKFTVEWGVKYQQLKVVGVDFPEDLLCFILIEACNLTEYQRTCLMTVLGEKKMTVTGITSILIQIFQPTAESEDSALWGGGGCKASWQPKPPAQDTRKEV
jgi:hypothetical protein